MNAAPGMAFIITVSDAAANQSAVFERIRGRITERAGTHGWVAACNTTQGTNSATTRLDALVGENALRAGDKLPQILSHPDVLMACNIYSVIFDFRNNRLLLASGEIPAAHGKFREYRLF